jgi:hypothetical protein
MFLPFLYQVLSIRASSVNILPWELYEISSSHGGKYEAQSFWMYCRVLNWMSTDAASIISAAVHPRRF